MSEAAVSTAARNPREAVQDVYGRLRRRILAGEFSGGEPLSQVRLARAFETSRGPVREALRMLERDGLIEAETNHRGRIATYTADDLEQVCAQLALQVAAAITMAEGRMTPADVRRLSGVLDRLERMANPAPGGNEKRRLLRRQLAFRRFVTLSCRYAGPSIVRAIDGLLDRIAMIRQMLWVAGDTPPYPLADTFPELRRAIETVEVREIARLVTMTIASVSTKAVTYMSKDHDHALLDAYVGFALRLSSEGAEPERGTGRDYVVCLRIDDGGVQEAELLSPAISPPRAGAAPRGAHDGAE